MKQPKVSIIIPTYNREKYLKECLDSIINQNYTNLEIIVTDDNSTDNTENIVKEYIKKHPFIRYVKNKKYPKGPNGNKNNGLDNATGEVIGIFDDDDILAPNAINILMEKILDGYDMVLGNCEIILNDKKTGQISGKGITESREVYYHEYLCGKISGEFWSLFKKSLLNHKRFDVDLYGGEGTLWKGLWKNSKIYYINRVVRFYRKHQNSIINSKINNAKIVIKNYERDIEYYSTDMKKYCPCYLATIYKGASYFAKLSQDIKKSFLYIFESIKLCPKYIKAYSMLIIIFLPIKFIQFLTNLKDYFAKN